MPGRPHHSEKWHRCWAKVKAQGHSPESAAAICSSSLLGSGQDIYQGKGMLSLPSAKKAKAARKARNAEDTVSETRYVHLLTAAGKVRTAEYLGRPHIVMPVTALVEGVLQAVNSSIPELVLAEEFSLTAPSWNGRPIVMNHPEVNGQKVSANDPRILEQYAFGHVFNSLSQSGQLGMEAWFDPERAKVVGKDALRTMERIEAADPKDPIEVSVGVFMVSEAARGIRNGKHYGGIWRHITPDHLAVLSEGKRGACSAEMGCGIRHATVYLATAEGYKEVQQEGSMSLWNKIKDLAIGRVPSDEEIRDTIGITTAEGCHCHEADEGEDMTKTERIKALMARPNNPVKDEKILAAASDDTLKTLEEHAEKMDATDKAAADAKAAADKTAADLKAAEDKKAADLKAAEGKKDETPKELTEEEFMKAAPASLRTMLERHKAADAVAHATLVTSLKTAQKVHDEAALKLKTLEQLQEIAALLQMAPVDYSLRTPMRTAEKDEADYKSQPPPDGYAMALEKRNKQQATH